MNPVLALHLRTPAQPRNITSLSSFEIQLVDPGTKAQVTNTIGWRVAVSLQDPTGTLIQIYPDNQNETFEMVGGAVHVEVPLLDPRAGNIFRVKAHVVVPVQAQHLVKPLSTLSMPLAAYPRVEGNVASNSNNVNINDGSNGSGINNADDDDDDGHTPQLGLRVTTAMQDVWYVDRHYPKFDVELYNCEDGQRVNVDGWEILVSIKDAFNQDANQTIYDYQYHRTHVLKKGTTSISGMRFRTVSSKSGGFYTIVLQLATPAGRPIPLTMTSPKIQVLSYRLYHAPKVPLERLNPHDAVSKMPGIGVLYAKRFAAIGIGRVEQLAAIDVNALGDEGTSRLLSTLRKERGSMTLMKLNKYIGQARNIVQRWRMQEAIPPQKQQMILQTPLAQVGAQQSRKRSRQEYQPVFELESCQANSNKRKRCNVSNDRSALQVVSIF